MVYYDKVHGKWAGTDPRLGEMLVLADTREKAELDLKIVLAEWEMRSEQKKPKP